MLFKADENKPKPSDPTNDNWSQIKTRLSTHTLCFWVYQTISSTLRYTHSYINSY